MISASHQPEGSDRGLTTGTPPGHEGETVPWVFRNYPVQLKPILSQAL